MPLVVPAHACTYNYDMLSRLTYAKITSIAPKPYMEWTNTYDDAGNLTDYTYDEGSGGVNKTYSFNGDLVTGDNTGKTVTWDVNNGRQTSQLNAVPADYAITYDWEGRLRQAKLGSANRRIEAKYTPDGARVSKKKVWDGSTVYNHKYVVDITGRVPAVLLVLDAENNNAILKTYIHANGQVIAQHNGSHTANKYFYLHDRLGSVRMVIDANGAAANCYTYDPWGLPVGNDTQETVSNMYLFANYVWDSEISQYHCYRRQYDPVLARFTSRDPVQGSYEEPLTLHKYLYCGNDSINKTDPTGENYSGALQQTQVLVNKMSALSGGMASGLDITGSDAWTMLDFAVGANAVRETAFAGGTPEMNIGGGRWPIIFKSVIIKAERRRGHGPWEDSAQHCWMACYLGIRFHAGTASALAQDITEVWDQFNDWKRDISANHYGGLYGDLLGILPIPNDDTSASKMCDKICETGL